MCSLPRREAAPGGEDAANQCQGGVMRTVLLERGRPRVTMHCAEVEDC
jgi:hypothetical protein